MQRLEQLRRDWQAHCQPLIEQCVGFAVPRMVAAAPAPGEPPPATGPSRLSTFADQTTHDWAERCVVGPCLDWLVEKGHWPNPRQPDNYVRIEALGTLQYLPGFEPMLPEPTAIVPVWSWAVAAAVGAIVGMVPSALLGWALTGGRETGLVAGGVAGAALLVLLVGWLAYSPLVRAALTYALALSSAGTLFGGIWSYWRQQSTTHWLQAGAGLLAGWFVVLIARPRLDWPSRDVLKAALEHAYRRHLRHLCDLVLGWCWAHPERLPPPTQPPPPEPTGLPEPLCRPLGALHSLVSGADTPPDVLKDVAEELLQRLEEEGYEWRTVPAGTPFDEAMRADFELLNRIEPGQPVRTRRPALHYKGKLFQKGELQRPAAGDW